MKKRELLERIEALEARAATLEARCPSWYPWWGYYPTLTITNTSSGTCPPTEPDVTPGGLTSDPPLLPHKIWCSVGRGDPCGDLCIPPLMTKE